MIEEIISQLKTLPKGATAEQISEVCSAWYQSHIRGSEAVRKEFGAERLALLDKVLADGWYLFDDRSYFGLPGVPGMEKDDQIFWPLDHRDLKARKIFGHDIVEVYNVVCWYLSHRN